MPRTCHRRILALTVGNDDAASSRVRVVSVLSALRADGWDVARVSAVSPLWPVVFFARLVAMSPDVTLIQKVVPPVWFYRLVAALSKRLVFECDDAIHLNHGDPALAVRNSRRLQGLLPTSDSVVVSNVLLKEDLKQLGAVEPFVFPGPAPRVSYIGDGERRGVLWLGSPSTFEYVRSVVYPALNLLPPSMHLMVIGAPRNAQYGQVTEQVWSADRQAVSLAKARVGIAPQPVDEWSQRKAFYKVLEYLAAGVVPVVPDQPAVNLLLGDELDTLAVRVTGDCPAVWAEAIMRANDVQVDDRWLAARDRVFALWSPARLGQVVIG
jgi:hypothetical protein